MSWRSLSMPKLFPRIDARFSFAGKAGDIETVALRNGRLQGAYFNLAGRAIGFVRELITGLDNAGIDRECFAGREVKSSFICGNLGYGDPSGIFAHSPHFAFYTMAIIIRSV